MDKRLDQTSEGDLMRKTASVVAAYVSFNPIPFVRLAEVIQTVSSAFRQLNGGVLPVVSVDTAKPAVPIKRSITPDYLVCLEDGRKMKTLKRHLRARYNLTPEAYRAKWQLPPDYPMVAPNYAAQRSDFAKRIGLGRNGR